VPACHPAVLRQVDRAGWLPGDERVHSGCEAGVSTAQAVIELCCCRLRTDVSHGHILPPSSSGTTLMSTRAAEGAARETWEEARARVSILAPYAHYDIPRIGQVRFDPPDSEILFPGIPRARQTLTCSSSHPVNLPGAKHQHDHRQRGGLSLLTP
jgi:8-oxo-dGTP pyrophosphatase MutT (NUDIX family)